MKDPLKGSVKHYDNPTEPVDPAQQTYNPIQPDLKALERYLASMKLEGIELTDKQLAMLDMFNQRGWNTQQCLDFVKAYYGYSKTN